MQHLIRSGHVTETGAARRAKIRTCGRPIPDRPRARCRDHVLLGLDADRCAFEVAVDPTPLTQLGEALALVEGRRTFSLRREAGGWVLDPRCDTDITSHPASTGSRADVVRQHRCQTTTPAGALAATSTFPEIRPAPAVDAVPPF